MPGGDTGRDTDAVEGKPRSGRRWFGGGDVGAYDVG